MLHHSNFSKSCNMHKPLYKLKQMEPLGNVRQINKLQPAPEAKIMNYVFLNERENWLLQLGLSRSCSHELAMNTLVKPEFNLSYFRQRWMMLSLQLGFKRQAEVNTIVLREIRELCQPHPAQMNCPKTPFISRGINWSSASDNSPLSDSIGIDKCYREPTYPQIYGPIIDHITTSKLFRESNVNFEEICPRDEPYDEANGFKHKNKNKKSNNDDEEDESSDSSNLDIVRKMMFM